MKPVYLFICGVLLAGSLSAQKFDLTISSGVGFNSKVKNAEPFTQIWDEPKAATAPVYSLKGAYQLKHWQIGLSVDKRTAIYRTYRVYPIIDYFWPSNMTLQEIEASMTFYDKFSYMGLNKSSYYPVKLQASRKLSFKKMETYGGLSAGYVILPGTLFSRYHTVVPDKDAAKGLSPFGKNSYCGTSIGFQAGTSYSFTKHIGINAEVNGDKTTFKQGPGSRLHMNTVSVNIGFRYRF